MTTNPPNALIPLEDTMETDTTSDIVVTHDLDANTELWFSPGEPVQVCLRYKEKGTTQYSHHFFDIPEWEDAILPYLPSTKREMYEVLRPIIESWK